ncbi:MAG: thioredoxin family protein [Gammaproteobacteria bacterium]|nr:thioredoxin family protein [Gammaproteobacteria bacterium]
MYLRFANILRTKGQLFCLWGCLFVSTLCFSGFATAAELDFFDQSLGDFSEELETARDEGKQGILIFFEMDECPFCHRMKTTILNQPSVAAYFKKHFMIFSLDIEGDVEIVDFQGRTTTQKDFAEKQHRVRATPVIAFFDLQGKRVVRYTGATSSAEEFIWLGEFVVSGEYKNTSFTRYKRERKKVAR